jgi:antitoxin (DNA-binding transcriptional repressor) of toxin-antitoxin stability system
MTIHVNIGEAKTKLSALIAAVKRGEKVIIDRDGQPEVELTPVSPEANRVERAARLRAWMGSKRDFVTKGGLDIIAQPAFTDEELDAMELRDLLLDRDPR